MWAHRFAVLLAITLAASCTSAHRMSVPDWPRDQDGDLAGFLRAPDEQVVRREPQIAVRRARGTVALPSTLGRRELPLEYLPTTPGTEGLQSGPPDYGVVDTRLFVIELRGPGTSSSVRTVAVRGGRFDFGPVPDGSYALKTTASGSPFALGWQSEVRTVIVSDTADAAAELTIQ
jgi:hypothetical protein